jgi:hypothetical protein
MNRKKNSNERTIFNNPIKRTGSNHPERIGSNERTHTKQGK